MKVGLIVGSLRKESYNRKIAEAVKELFPANVEAEFIDITNLPLYNTDLEGENGTPEYGRVREEVRKYDGYIFFTPEYNRSLAPALKNLIDVVSVDPNGNAWAKKPAAVFSATMGPTGAMASNLALRQAFVYVDLIPMQQPEVYLSTIQDSFDEEGNMTDRTRNFLAKAVDAFVKHAELVSRQEN